MNTDIKNLLYNLKRQLKKLLFNKQFKLKGHELIKKHQGIISKVLKDGSNIIEIGSERKAGSTLYLSKLAKKSTSMFYTVDIDPETSSAANKIVAGVSPYFRSVNQPGEEFLKNFKEQIQLVYLDAFDIPGDWIDPSIINKYENRGQKLTLENCWKMHYDCAISIVKKMPIGGFVCFDDVNPVDKEGNLIFNKVAENYEKWSGKGETAIPYLLNNGFIIIDNKRACALLKKVS